MPTPQDLDLFGGFDMKLFKLALLGIIFGVVSTATVANAQSFNKDAH
ncbi:hypothetical protein DSM106972_086940 [Dulcicalothrix desertica PCC 7102]|uniref:Uncharacterized protein n=1 Tax=Dulcicalothrix desertica PCC 7102 TaxID=232991 RepID=A0A433US58_9CYAN|nr:hypothetical protein [Dulcicalothrix desertica]RUS96671.1 hypothetical protein DSM106972_086940 [Dulcicalothrix desertica PCC 7102]TWH54857.1 hypothetical protein CAL7102_02932 [Dulcicalothrix desertica PCC 7102]